MKWHIPEFTACDKDCFLLFMVEIWERLSLRVAGQLKRIVAVWCLVACPVAFVKVFHFFLVFQNQEVMSQQQAQPHFSPEEKEGPHWAWQGEKNTEEPTSGQVSLCVHLPKLFLGDDLKRSLHSWWVSQRGYGGPGFSTWVYGTLKDLWLLWVWQLGKDRLRWIWTSIQSPACTVENMAGYQVPSLSSCWWKVSDSCWAAWIVFEPVFLLNDTK